MAANSIETLHKATASTATSNSTKEPYGMETSDSQRWSAGLQRWHGDRVTRHSMTTDMEKQSRAAKLTSGFFEYAQETTKWRDMINKTGKCCDIGLATQCHLARGPETGNSARFELRLSSFKLLRWWSSSLVLCRSSLCHRNSFDSLKDSPNFA